MVLGHFKVEIAPLIAGLGVFGLAIAFGLKETMANLFAALFLVIYIGHCNGNVLVLVDISKMSDIDVFEYLGYMCCHLPLYYFCPMVQHS
mgnify:CR=1 FL=1